MCIMAYFDQLCPILTGLIFSNWILWLETKVIWKKHGILQDGKFLVFSFGEIRFLFCFNLLNLWTFAVSLPNGGCTSPIIECQVLSYRFAIGSHNGDVEIIPHISKFSDTFHDSLSN